MLSSTVHHWQKCKISAKKLDKIAAKKDPASCCRLLGRDSSHDSKAPHQCRVQPKAWHFSQNRGGGGRCSAVIGPCSVPSRQCLQLKSSVSERQKCPLHPTAMSSNSSPSSSSFFTAAWTGLPYNSPHALYTAVRLSQTARMPRKT